MNTLYALYGLVTPAAAGVLALAAKDSIASGHLALVAVLFVAVLAAGIAYGNSLWVDAHQYVAYMYGELMPRMYAITGISAQKNLFQHMAGSRERWTWQPIYVFHLMLLLVMVSVPAAAGLAFPDKLGFGGWKVLAVSVVPISLAAYTSYITHKSAIEVFCKLRQSTNRLPLNSSAAEPIAAADA